MELSPGSFSATMTLFAEARANAPLSVSLDDAEPTRDCSNACSTFAAQFVSEAWTILQGPVLTASPFASVATQTLNSVSSSHLLLGTWESSLYPGSEQEDVELPGRRPIFASNFLNIYRLVQLVLYSNVTDRQTTKKDSIAESRMCLTSIPVCREPRHGEKVNRYIDLEATGLFLYLVFPMIPVSAA